MKLTFLLNPLLLITLFISACGAQTPSDAWMVFDAASDTLVNPQFPAYSFEYPSYWELEEAANHITFASEAKGPKIELFFINLTLPGLRATMINT